MSNTDSFIEEVSEEVRKDQLYGYLRKYGWILVLIVVVSVGGAAYFEWSKASRAADAQARGDAIIAALNNDAAVDRADAIAALKGKAPTTDAFLDIQRASVLAEDGDIEGAATALEAVAADGNSSQIYRDLANLKLILLQGATMDPASRSEKLLGLSRPGGAFRPLALEQTALFKALDGDTDAAIADLKALLNEPQVSAALRNRVQQTIVSLGGSLSDGPTLLNNG